MKKTLIIVLLLLAATSVNAQISVGGGAAFFGNPGLEIKADIGLTDEISFSPSFDYYLIGFGITGISLSGDGHYSLGDPDSLNYYPLLGLNLVYVSASYAGYRYYAGSAIGITAGAGGTYAISDHLKLYGEAKYMARTVGISAGILYTF